MIHKKLLSLLVLLAAVATGAWAQETVTWGHDELSTIKVVDARVYDAYPALAWSLQARLARP